MPDCSENYEAEIQAGQNKRIVKCKFCSSVIINPSNASFVNLEYELPLIKQTKDHGANPETETTYSFWAVVDMFLFENIGFSNTVGDTKYLTCADCEAGPIGYHDISTKMSYIALTRVSHGDAEPE